MSLEKSLDQYKTKYNKLQNYMVKKFLHLHKLLRILGKLLKLKKL